MSATMWSDDLVQSKQPFAVPDADSGEEAEGAASISPQAQRKRVNRMLRLLKRKATFYELLDVKADATEKDVHAAWKKIVGGLHPDKNKDKAAQECTQAANAAKDVLVDPRKRQIYDNFVRTNPPPSETETFDEHFAHGAFDEDSSNDAMEEDGEDDCGEDSGEDDEKHYPPPDRQIQKLHNKMSPYIKAFFQDIEGSINFPLLDAVDKLNKQIEKENYNDQRPVTIYEVPRQKLLLFQYAQRRIVMNFETMVFSVARAQKEVSWLREHFNKIRQEGLYNWPVAWAQLLMDPLIRKLESLGMPRQQHMLLEAEDNTVSHNLDKDGDVDMDDVDIEGIPMEPMEDSEADDGDEEAENVCHQDTGRRTKPVRAGFTSFGDPILGYFPVHRWSKALGEPVILGFKVFVKVDDINPIRIVSGTEVGDAAVLAYHQLPGHKKNDIRENAAKYAIMAPADFVGITGVAWIPSSNTGRLPITYVWAKTQTRSRKPTIMTRTTFRQWLGTSLADKHINSWLFSKGIIPEWAASATDSKSLQLTYPLPDLMSRVQASGVEPPTVPSEEDDRVKELGEKFDQLLDLFTRGQQEAREDRRQQWEIMRSFLPAPSSGS
ncbi:hypothetical protein F5Y07DRAFT_404406 [Xylaria sp. FL0933]|nr:hypothetical protein F5Y07DRAFT_404406 [Xylaria sp. FL0933]